MASTASFSSATYLHSFRHRTSLHGSSNVDCNHSENQVTRTNVSFWRSSASYAKLDCGLNKFCGKPVVKQLQKRLYLSGSDKITSLPVDGKGLNTDLKRAGIIRSATIEEIEAEKSLIEKDVKQRMEKTIETIRSNFNSVRTSRANPSMLDRVEVEYYGSPVGLKTIAQISTPDASSLLITPYDKSSLKSIEKAIVTSQLGISPSNDGEVIRLSLPPLTSDRRKELSKVVAKLAEEGKVALRNIRRDALKAYDKLEKEKKLSEDNVKDLSSDLQKMSDEYMKKVETIYKQKEQELMKV